MQQGGAVRRVIRRFRGRRQVAGAWGVVGALLLTLVIVSSLVPRHSTPTNDSIARASQELPHERSGSDRN